MAGAEKELDSSRKVKQFINKSYLKQVLDDEVIEISDNSDQDEGGMMALSQALQNVSDTQIFAINDDEDMDGSALFGDADEQKEL